MSHNHGPLIARLSVLRSEYAPGEDTVVRLSLRNDSSRGLTINGRCAVKGFPGGRVEKSWEVDFTVARNQQPCPRFGVIIETRPVDFDNFIVLDGGAEYHCEYAITKYFIMDQPGDYEIQAIYRNSHDGQEYGLMAWTGQIVSNRVRVRISD